jgi:hypothetical protein
MPRIKPFPHAGDCLELRSVTNWTSTLTQSFNGVNFSFTNAVNPTESQRFFLLQFP